MTIILSEDAANHSASESKDPAFARIITTLEGILPNLPPVAPLR